MTNSVRNPDAAAVDNNISG